MGLRHLPRSEPRDDFTRWDQDCVGGDEILSSDLRRFLWGYVTNTTLDTALEAAESYFHVQPAVYIDSNGYVICSPERPKITLAADGN